MDLSKNIPSYLTEKKNIVRLILFTAAFALIFIYFYAPFEVNDWIYNSADKFNIKNPDLLLFISSGMITLTGVLVVVISRIILYQVVRITGQVSFLQYFIWIAAEIVFMSLFYAFFERIFLDDPRKFSTAYKISIQNTALVLLLPYSISWLYFSWVDKNKRIKELQDENMPLSETKDMIVFYDEKGTMRLSIKFSDLLYLQAADNYVNIAYINKDKHIKYMLRSSLKNIEDDYSSYPLIRCHRSYMVNLEKIKIIRREKDGLHIELDAPLSVELPVSKTYVDDVFKAFGHSLNQENT